MNDFQYIKDAALLDSERLLAQWLPDGKQQGREWVACNPWRDDRKAGSFSVNLDSGLFNDFSSGCSGDLIDLCARVHSITPADAARMIASDLGLTGLSIQDGTSTPEQQAANELLRKQVAEQAAQRRQRADEAEKVKHEQVADFSRAVWDDAAPAPDDHGYLVAKKVRPHGVRVAMGSRERTFETGEVDQQSGEKISFKLWVTKGDLLIPLHDEAGQLVNLQRIMPDGQKWFFKGGKIAGTSHRIDGKSPAYIAEGYATAASVHEATGHAVYVALSAGNLKAIASQKSDAGFIAADNDSHKTSAGEVAAKTTGLPYAMPPDAGDDWNDYAIKHGVAATEQALQAALQPLAPPEPLAPAMDKPDAYPVEALPEIMRDAVLAIADFVQCPIALAGHAVLSAATYLAQTRVDAVSEVAYQMPCSLFMLALADSGDRKSSADRLASKPVADRERERQNKYWLDMQKWKKGMEGLNHKDEKAYLKDNPRPADPASFVSSDASYSTVASMLINGKPALFWSTDEGGQMLGGHSMKADNVAAVLGGLTQWWDKGEGERVRSKDNADGSGKAYNKRLSISLMAQDVTVKSALKDPLLCGQGFLPRFLFTAPASLKGTRFSTPERRAGLNPADIPSITRYWQQLEKLLSSPEALDPELPEVKAERLEWTQEARNLWWDFYDRTEGDQGRFNRYAEMAPFASRAGELAARVATVLAFFCERDHIDREIMLSAVALVEHSLNEWLRYASVVQVDAVTDGAIKCIDWLVKQVQDGKTQWLEFHANYWGKSGYLPYQTAAKRDAVFAVLTSKGHLLQSGRTYRINPYLLQDQAGHSAESADIAESPVNTGFAVADEVRKGAEKVRTESPAQEIRKTSAPIRKTSVTANPHEQRASAQSAQSAPAGHWEGTI